MKDRILRGWTFIRAIYLMFGLIVLVNAALDGQWLGIFLGAYVASMGLFGFGCAGGACYRGNCEYPAQKNFRAEKQEADVKTD